MASVWLFFNGVRYALGHNVFSLHDLENGILRGNRHPPYHFNRCFQKKDPRLPTVLPCDYRIHFALNCGARSCPAVKWYTLERLEEELNLAASGWVDDDANVRVDSAKRVLYLSKICKWYDADFGSNAADIAAVLKRHARGEKALQLDGVTKRFATKHLDYDWSVNFTRSKPFTDSNFKVLVTGVSGIVQ